MDQGLIKAVDDAAAEYPFDGTLLLKDPLDNTLFLKDPLDDTLILRIFLMTLCYFRMLLWTLLSLDSSPLDGTSPLDPLLGFSFESPLF